MKRLFLAALVILGCFSVSTAQVRFAIAGGGHQSKVNEESDYNGFAEYSKGFSARTGLHFGFMADIPFSPKSRLSFQTGVLLQNRGRKHFLNQDTSYKVVRPLLPDTTVNTTYQESRKQFINYIDIPLNLVYKLPLGRKAKFIIGGGPYLSLFYNGADKKEKNVIGYSYKTDDLLDLPVGNGPDKYKIFNYGVNGLAGFELGRVFLTFNYTRGLNDSYELSNMRPWAVHWVYSLATLLNWRKE
jgi:OOP family OmpA-OmpF porin